MELYTHINVRHAIAGQDLARLATSSSTAPLVEVTVAAGIRTAQRPDYRPLGHATGRRHVLGIHAVGALLEVARCNRELN